MKLKIPFSSEDKVTVKDYRLDKLLIEFPNRGWALVVCEALSRKLTKLDQLTVKVLVVAQDVLRQQTILNV